MAGLLIARSDDRLLNLPQISGLSARGLQKGLKLVSENAMGSEVSDDGCGGVPY